jgi:hypothetical protein
LSLHWTASESAGCRIETNLWKKTLSNFERFALSGFRFEFAADRFLSKVFGMLSFMLFHFTLL